MLQTDENDIQKLELYACNRKLYLCIDVKSMASRDWWDFIAVDDVDLHYNTDVEVKGKLHVSKVAKGMQSLHGRLLIVLKVKSD